MQRWFEKFESGFFDLNNKPRFGTPSLIDDNIVRTVIQQDSFFFDNIEDCGKARLNTTGTRFGNLHDRVFFYTFLLLGKNEPFLDGMITSDKKWIT